MRDYTKIKAWQVADDLTVAVYGLTRRFPKEEIYGLTSQLRRAAYSVPANIAEGSARESKKDYLHFFYIARASLTECQYFLHLAHRLGYLSGHEHGVISGDVKPAFVMLHGLVKAVEKESGRISKAMALITSALVLAIPKLLSPSLPA